MGFEVSSEKRLVIKKENEAIEISPLKSENCDAIESFTVDYLIDLVISEKICDIRIDVSKITILELSECKLTDLPEVCKKLNLKHLGLSCNNITNVPSCLYTGLKYLESLDLSNNKIKQFDMEPECLPFVKVVRLNNNNFENIPKWFLTFRCTNLEEFNYSCNKANHYKYLKNSFCLNLIKLKKLELRNSCLIDRDYDFLKCFKSISYLDISNEGLTTRNCLNKFHELDELFVKPKWKELHILRLESLSISLFPEGIAWIETLRELYLTNNNLSWLLDDIQFLVNLEVLDISNNSIVAIPSTLVSLVNLTVLRASDNSIESVFDFSLMHNLKTLDLYNNLLDTIAFSMDTIDFVDLEGNYYDTKHFENYSAYEEKKNFLRNRYSYQRYDGPKTVLETFTSSSSDSDEDAYYERSLKIDCTSSNLISIDETENWDLPVKSKMKNPEIDSVDDDWQGEDKKFYLKGYSKKDRVYVSDDDWMFIDFEES